MSEPKTWSEIAESCPNCSAYLEGSAEWEAEARLAKLKLIGVRKEIELAIVEVRTDLSTVYGPGKRIYDILERAFRESR